jgi:hypothetical protein
MVLIAFIFLFLIKNYIYFFKIVNFQYLNIIKTNLLSLERRQGGQGQGRAGAGRAEGVDSGRGWRGLNLFMHTNAFLS